MVYVEAVSSTITTTVEKNGVSELTVGGPSLPCRVEAGPTARFARPAPAKGLSA